MFFCTKKVHETKFEKPAWLRDTARWGAIPSRRDTEWNNPFEGIREQFRTMDESRGLQYMLLGGGTETLRLCDVR